MKNIISLLAGFIFSLGLVISGMTNPQKVKGFLDIFGHWDMSLMFVMGGAVVFNFIAFKVITRKSPLFASEFQLPKSDKIDKKLILGSALFGIGWGLFGVCPGPGLVNLALGQSEIVTFVASMVAGMIIYQFAAKKGWI